MAADEKSSVSHDISSNSKPSTDSNVSNSPEPVPAPSTNSKSKSNIIIRSAKSRDLPAISRILADAFWDEDAMGRFTHPLRNRYPADIRRYWHRRMRGSVAHWAHDLIVAVDAQSLEVRGVADWVRNGPGAEKAKGKGWKWVFRHLIKQAVRITNATGEHLRPNRAEDRSKRGAYNRATPFFAHFWAGPRADVYDLSCLGVDPAHHGEGIGRALVAWGMRRADDEDVAASVVSSAGKERFYVACGFEEVVGNVTHGEGNPLAGVKGGEIMFLDRRKVREVKEKAAAAAAAAAHEVEMEVKASG